jgi:hypothetical protein
MPHPTLESRVVGAWAEMPRKRTSCLDRVFLATGTGEFNQTRIDCPPLRGRDYEASEVRQLQASQHLQTERRHSDITDHIAGDNLGRALQGRGKRGTGSSQHTHLSIYSIPTQAALGTSPCPREIQGWQLVCSVEMGNGPQSLEPHPQRSKCFCPWGLTSNGATEEKTGFMGSHMASSCLDSWLAACAPSLISCHMQLGKKLSL